MKHKVIALNIHQGEISVGGLKTKITLPKGCIGICLAFESKKTAREYCGKDVKFIRVEKREK